LDAIARYFYQNSNIKVYINHKKLDSEFKPYKYTFCRTIDLDAWKTADERFRDRMNKKLGLIITFEFDPMLSPLDSDGSVNSLSSTGKNTDLGVKIVTQGLKDYFHINHNYITLGLKMKTIMMIGEAEFDSQTKERLTGIPGLGRNDWMKFSDEMYNICKHNPEIGEHIALLNEYAASMKQLTNKDLIKSKVYIEGEQVGSSGAKLKPAKLRDALGKDREKCDLFIVEGDSAGSGLIDTRDPLTVGVLPLRGVPLNSANLDITDVLENDEMKDLISAIGMGTTELRGSKARYGRIIIAADADIDGLKITALVLGCILRHMPFLIEMGMVYIADSPLYFQDGKYYYKGEEDQMKKNKGYTRFKGLGELNSDQIDDIFFHGNCRLVKVNQDGAEYALRLITNKDARKDLMREIGCLREYLLDK
jgi:DNA gyrase/topoisomerase IV subunit B